MTVKALLALTPDTGRSPQPAEGIAVDSPTPPRPLLALPFCLVPLTMWGDVQKSAGLTGTVVLHMGTV